MTSVQSNTLAMLRAVQAFLTALLGSPTATSLFPALAEKFATLKTLIIRIVELAAVQEAPRDGILRDRAKTLLGAVEATLGVAAGVLSYALTHERHDLAAQVTVRRSDFDHMRWSGRMRLAQRVHDAALPLVAELAPYGVTAARLADLQQRIAATDEAVDAPVESNAAKKVATLELARAFAEVDRLLDQMDPLLFPLKAADPKGYARYYAARQVFDRRGGHATAPDATAAPVASVAGAAPVASVPLKAAA